MENLTLADFDLFGLIKLQDVEGIEELVTPVGNGEYYSRGKIFAHQFTCAQASDYREKLKSMLSCSDTEKKSFVILDHMMNFSAKVYYEEIQRAINKGDYSGLYKAKECLLEDVKNVIRVIEHQPIEISKKKLPKSNDYIAVRQIECNNAALLYTYAKSFTPPEDSVILNPGLGAMLIGPFFSAIYGNDWTNLLKSKYTDEKYCGKYDLMQSIVSKELLQNKTIILLDDNVGTGKTSREIETEFQILGCNIATGAIQYNWRNFYLVGIGEKDIERFNPRSYDLLSPFNYPGNKCMKHAYSILFGDRDLNGNEPSLDKLTPTGKLYEEYKKTKGYCIENVSDSLLLMLKGIKYCVRSGINYNENVTDNQNSLFTLTAIEILNNIDRFIFENYPNTAELSENNEILTKIDKAISVDDENINDSSEEENDEEKAKNQTQPD